MPSTVATETAVADAYEALELQLLQAMAERLKRDSDVADWQLRKLAELASLHALAKGKIERTTREAAASVREVLETRYEGGSELANEILDRLDGSEEWKGALAPSRPMAAIVSETLGNLSASGQQILRTVDDAYRAIIAEVSAPGMIAGTVTRRDAVQNALNAFAEKGITGFTDRAGRQWEMRAYAEMATGTAAHRASTQGHLDQLADRGNDLVRVSDHKGECEKCRPWEGKVLSISGVVNTKDLEARLAAATDAFWETQEEGWDGTFEEMDRLDAEIGRLKRELAEARQNRYPTVAEARAGGLEHPGCRHRFGAYFPGISGPQTPQGKPGDYEARTRQREMERALRGWKRRAAVGDPKAAAKVSEWQSRIREHVSANGLKRRYDREAIRDGILKSDALGEKRKTPVAPKVEPAPVPFSKRPPGAPKPVTIDDLDEDTREWYEDELLQDLELVREYLTIPKRGLRDYSPADYDAVFRETLARIEVEKVVWSSDEFYEKFTPGAPRTLLQSQRDLAANPHGNDSGLSWFQEGNCTRVTLASELRARGYDVAARLADFPDQKSVNFTSMWRTAEGEMRDATTVHSWTDFLAATEGDPPGARYAVSGEWKLGGGHIWNAERVEGGVLFREGQIVPTTDAPTLTRDYLKKLNWDRGIEVFRVDDLYPTDAIVNADWVEEVKK